MTEVPGHCWRNRSEVVNEILIWNPQHGRRYRGRYMKTYLDQSIEDTIYTNEELSIAMNGGNV